MSYASTVEELALKKSVIKAMDEILFKCMFPVSRHSSKKNEKEPGFNRRKSRFFIKATEAAILSKNELNNRLIVEKLKQRIDTIGCDVNAKFIFYFPESIFYTKKGVRSKKLPDLSNLYEMPQDCLQAAKIIDDDTIIVSHDGSRRKPIEGARYWLQIELTSSNN